MDVLRRNLLLLSILLPFVACSCSKIDEEEIITTQYLQKITEIKGEETRFTKEECNIYASLDTSMRIIGRIPAYKKVTITSFYHLDDNKLDGVFLDFSKVEYSGLEGYVNTNKLTGISWEKPRYYYLENDYAQFYDVPEFNGSPLKYERGTVFTVYGVLMMDPDGKDTWYITETSGRQVFINEKTAINSFLQYFKNQRQEELILYVNETNLYKFPDNGQLISKIEQNEKLKYLGSLDKTINEGGILKQYIEIETSSGVRGWISNSDVLSNPVEIGDDIYGIHLFMIKPFEAVKGVVQFYNRLVRYSPRTGHIIKYYEMQTKNDYIISIEIDTAMIVNENILKVKYCLNEFNTAVVLYDGFEYFRINRDGSLGEKVFSFFERNISEPYGTVELESMETENEKTSLVYRYKWLGESDAPSVLEGRIELSYQYNNVSKKIDLEKANNIQIKARDGRALGNEPIEMSVRDVEAFNKQYGFLHASDPIIFY